MGGTSSGSVGLGNARIVFHPYPGQPIIRYYQQAIHELIHAAGAGNDKGPNGGYSDYVLAKAANKIQKSGLPLPFGGRPPDPKNEAEIIEYSKYWDNRLAEVCRTEFEQRYGAQER